MKSLLPPHLMASIMPPSEADALASAILAEIDYLQQRLNYLASVAIQLQAQIEAERRAAMENHPPTQRLRHG